MQQYPPDSQPTWVPAARQTPPPPPVQSYPQGYKGPPSVLPPKRKRRLWLWLVGGVLAIIVIGALAFAANGHSPSPSVSISTPTGPAQASAPTRWPAATPTPRGNRIGQPVSLVGWLITVNGVKRVAGSGFNTPQKPGDIFLWVDVTLHNGTGQPQPVSSLAMFSLKDGTGQTYDQSIDTDAPASPDGTLANGGKLRGTVVFEVPTSMHVFEFDFTPDFSGAQASWTFRV